MRIDRTLEPLRAVASLFYPALCAICHAPAARGDYVCQDCLDKAQRIVAPFCAKCSEPFAGAIDGEFTCANCANRTLGFDAAVSAYRSRGVVRFIVLQFKYNRQLQLRHPIAEWLREAMNDARLRQRHFHLVIPVPLHPTRRRERGARINHGHFQKTRDQNSRAQEARYSAGTFSEVSRMRRSHSRNRTDREPASLPAL